MKHINLGIALLVSAIGVSQTQMSATEAASFKKDIQSESSKTKTISADFDETKHVSVLKKASTSSGIFRLKGERKKKVLCCLTNKL